MKNKFDRKNVTITVLLNEKLKKQKKKQTNGYGISKMLKCFNSFSYQRVYFYNPFEYMP